MSNQEGAVKPHSDYIIFADESGDHSLTSINPDYPLFVLCFCIVEKSYYVSQIVPEVHRIKMRYFGHDQVIFHERDFVKRIGEFGALSSRDREGLLSDLSNLMAQANMTLTAAVIRKASLKDKYSYPYNPYHIGLKFCLERAHTYLISKCQQNRLTHVIAESRGKFEDRELKAEFQQIIDGGRNWGFRRHDFKKTPLCLYCSPKGANSSGMQLADLMARPIGLSRLRPTQTNRAYETIREKIWAIKEFP